MHYFCTCWVLLLAVFNGINTQYTSPNWQNVALNKPCNMSSIYTGQFPNNDCSKAINGNAGTTYKDGNCIHTADTDRTPSLKVDLGDSYIVRGIRIYARAGIDSQKRMGYVQVTVDSTGVYTFPADTRVSTWNTTDIQQTTQGSSLPNTGRYVTLSKNTANADDYNNILINICEVEVWVCKPGFYGPNCGPCRTNCTNIACDDIQYNSCHDPCYPSPCQHSGTCQQGTAYTYTCQCGGTGYQGSNCEQDIDECSTATNPCHNGGTCVNTEGSYTCTCVAAFTGKHCDDDVNECLTTPSLCHNGGTCTNIVGSYRCDCTANFTGTRCDDDVNECLTTPGLCHNGGTCRNTVGSYYCNCTASFTGTHCDDDVNECLTNTGLCHNGGTCRNTIGSYSCDCTASYNGTHCDDDVNECLANTGPCLNNGNCSNTFGSYSCSCSIGFNGTRCEHMIKNSPSEQDPISISIGAAVGIAVAAAAVIVIVVVIVVIVRRRKAGPQGKSRAERREENGNQNNNTEFPTISDDGRPRANVRPMQHHNEPSPHQAASEALEDGEDNTNQAQSAGHVYGNIPSREPKQPPPSTSGAKPKAALTPANSDNRNTEGAPAIPVKTSKPVVPVKPSGNQSAAAAAPKPAIGHVYANVAGRGTDGASQAAQQHGDKSKGDKRKTQHGADEEDDGEEIYGHADLYACYKPVQKSLIDSFQKRLLDSLKNSEMLDSEFEEFPKGMPHPHAVGSDPKNTRMNRFQRLCAYDKNRVLLRRPRNDPGTDYINASWIKGVDNDRAYIATQGPRVHTVGDLWWMVWQEDVTQIVMLTNCKEDGRDKCDQYWPEAGESMTCGHVVVSSQGEDQRADFTVRTFLIHLKEDKHTERTVYQYHYVTWPDHGVPAAGSLVNYWRYVTSRAHTNAPPVIHCSAGVGRTGTYIALDIALAQKARGHDVNIFDIVMELREQRSIMVQTEVQYKFLHEVILEAYTSRDTRMKAEQLDVNFTTDIHLDQPNNTIDQEFKLLKEMKEWAKPNHTTAQLTENKDKNRDPNVLPVDDCMTYLSVYVRGRNQYINAVSLSSFKVKRGLLLTQLPLPSTVVDLWRLVDGCDVNTILSLGGKNDEKTVKNFCRYWPRADEELTCDPYVVTLSSLLRVSPNINIVSVMMTHKEKSQTVKIVQYTDWDGELPGSISDVLYLINAVAEASDVSDVPVVIQCLDGATRSGLFSVLYDVITHMTQDEELDIFSTVRQVQCVRREAVASEKHYRYCYKVAQEFKRSRSIYANT